MAGKQSSIGKLIDCGLDIIVFYDGDEYLYIPTVHIRHFKPVPSSEMNDLDFEIQPESLLTDDTNSISFRKILNNAKGRFTKIFVTGNMSIHGYVTNTLNNYFTFYSPIFKTIFISLEHLKWLVPYDGVQTPYSLNKHEFPLYPSNISLARSFEEQLKKLEDRLVVFNLGKTPNHIGLLKKVDNNIIELINAENEVVYLTHKHIMSIHLP